jgi:hypothetical protein
MLALGGTVSRLDAHHSRILQPKRLTTPHRHPLQWPTKESAVKQPTAVPCYLWRPECDTHLG